MLLFPLCSWAVGLCFWQLSECWTGWASSLTQHVMVCCCFWDLFLVASYTHFNEVIKNVNISLLDHWCLYDLMDWGFFLRKALFMLWNNKRHCVFQEPATSRGSPYNPQQVQEVQPQVLGPADQAVEDSTACLGSSCWGNLGSAARVCSVGESHQGLRNLKVGSSFRAFLTGRKKIRLNNGSSLECFVFHWNSVCLQGIAVI